MKLEAHAKLNLTLEVLGRRHDGYHNLVSVLQTIDLHDEIEIAPSDSISLDCDVPELAGRGTHSGIGSGGVGRLYVGQRGELGG